MKKKSLNLECLAPEVIHRQIQAQVERGEGYHFDDREAKDAVAFFEKFLKHSKGREFAGKPFILEPWQKELISAVFGWKDKQNLRRFQMVYVEVPKKNGKSEMGAGVALKLTYADKEPGAEVYSAAGDRFQAGIVFKVASRMVMNSPPLKRRGQVFRNSIVVPGSNSVYHVLSSDAPTKHGFDVYGVVVDELHVQPNRELWDTLTMGTASRTQPLVWAMTTAGFDRTSICYEIHRRAERVISGELDDPSFLSIITSAEPEDDWTDERTWWKANPNLGVSLKLAYLRVKCREAQDSPEMENTFKRLHLNIWTEQDIRWIPMDRWDRCGTAPLTLDALKGQKCYAALDLSSTRDITALVLLFPMGNHFVVLPFFWIPKENAAKRQRKDHVPYLTWTKQGFIRLTEGPVTDIVDYDTIRRDIRELMTQYNIVACGIDRWAAAQITSQLMGDGLEMIPFGQGFGSMSGPSKEFEKLILAEQLVHGKNPVLRWMAKNAVIQQDAAGNIKPDKKHSIERIDGIVATVMALGIATSGGFGEEGDSIYETQELTVI